jgi:hypothetical protein
LDNIQLASGFVYPKMDFIDKGWITNLRERLDEIGGKLWIEDAWQPKLAMHKSFEASKIEKRLLSHYLHHTHQQRLASITQLENIMRWRYGEEKMSFELESRTTGKTTTC